MISLLIISQLVQEKSHGAAFESYRAHVFSAQASLSMGDTALAKRWLGNTETQYRGWEYDYLQAQTDMSLRTLNVLHDPARIEFSTRGRIFATSNLDGTVSIFDASSLEKSGVLQGHGGQVWGLALSPDGKTIATTSRDTTVRLWDVASKKEIATLGKHPTTPYSCAFSPDGKWIATPGWQMDPATNGPAGLISVWDVENKKLHKQWMVTTHPISSVAFSPDGKYAAFGCWESQTLVYDTTDWSLKISIFPEESESYKGIDWIEYSSDGKSILTACKDKSARLYEVATGKLLSKFVGNGNVTCARFSSDGQFIVTSSTDQNLRVYSKDGRLVETLRGHVDSVRSFALDGPHIVSIGEDQTLRKWGTRGAQDYPKLDGTIWSAVPSPDGEFIAVGGIGNDVTILRPNGTLVRSLSGAERLTVDVAWSADGSRVIAGSNDGTARVWTVADGIERQVFRVGERGQVRGVDYSKKAPIVAVGQGKKLVLWSPETGDKIHETAIEQGAYSVAISPDGTLVATGYGSKVSLVSTKDGSIVRTLVGANQEINEIAWGPDARTLAIGGGGGRIHLYDTATGDKLREINDMTLACWGLAFSPDGKRLAATGYDFTVRLFDVTTGAEVFQVRDMPGIGFDVQWHPDGRRLIHADTDGRVTVFDSRPLRERS